MLCFLKIGESLDKEPDPDADEIVFENMYPPDYKCRQRRFSRMLSLENKILNLKETSSAKHTGINHKSK